MIIAKNDEDKRSRVWNYVTGITTVLIIIVAGYFIYQGFFGNPLEGKWKHDESDMILEVDDHNEAELDWKNLIDGKDVDVELGYTLDIKAKQITFTVKQEVLDQTAKELGDNVTLYQGVTLGGTGKEQGKRHPTLKDNVMVSAGAKVLGSFTIGENSKIGAGSVVLNEVPPNCTVVGVPGRIVKMGNLKIPRADMDQVHLPDPVTSDISQLQRDNIMLKERVSELEKELRKNNKDKAKKEKKNETV